VGFVAKAYVASLSVVATVGQTTDIELVERCADYRVKEGDPFDLRQG